MRQLTVQLDDKEMAQLELAARARHMDPVRMTKMQLLRLLSVQKPKWRTGLRLRRQQAMTQLLETTDLKRSLSPQKLRPGPQPATPNGNLSPADAARAKRLAAIMSVHGMWKDDPDKPQDAVGYQREARSEWR